MSAPDPLTGRHSLRIYTDGSAWYGHRPAFAFCVVRDGVLEEAHVGLCGTKAVCDGGLEKAALFAEADAVAAALAWLALRGEGGEIVTDCQPVSRCCRILMRERHPGVVLERMQLTSPELSKQVCKRLCSLLRPVTDDTTYHSVWWERRGSTEWNGLADTLARTTRELHGRGNGETAGRMAVWKGLSTALRTGGGVCKTVLQT
jgi:hypothetical protein